MRALTYHGAKNVRVENLPNPIIQQPGIIVSHHMKLADAARGYEMLEEKRDGCRKITLTP